MPRLSNLPDVFAILLMTQLSDFMLSQTVENIDRALEAQLNFFAYRMPGLDSEVYFGASPRIVDGLADNAFVIGAFDNSSLFSIPADYTDLATYCVQGNCHIEDTDIPTSTSRADHRHEVETICAHLSSAGGGKVVAARTLTIPKHVNVSKSFAALCQAYPTAFVSCFYSSHSGLWLGASPETLLRLHDDRLETMALAGTRPRTNNPNTPHPFNFSAPAWDSKNIEEQQLVVDFICRTMLDNGLQPRTSWRFTRTAGPVEHNCTRITASAAPLHNSPLQIRNLLTSLSPTPAVCGSDRQLSLTLISSLESFPRTFYGGFIGPMKHFGDFDLFVNLRCCRIFSSAFTLYAGGGITSRSLPDDEWDETERKLSTLMAKLIYHN